MISNLVATLVPMATGDGTTIAITIGGPVLAMVIFGVFSLLSLSRKSTSNLWAILWAVLFGLAFAATPAGAWVVDATNGLFGLLAKLFGGSSV